MTPRRTLVVVDGSNLATEGRTTPSLAQLEEAVAAYRKEQPAIKPIVVVDATFGHRIAAAERQRFKDAELAGELVTPPAGAIGRGDAFILKIAARSDAIVLSNDSFQEFQTEHPWLFEEGRLVGGKPVRGVGWIFTPRLPVRAVKAAKVAAKAAALPAARTAAQAAPARSAPAKAPAAAKAPATKASATPTAPRGRRAAASATVTATTTPTKARKATASAPDQKAPARARAERAPRRAAKATKPAPSAKAPARPAPARPAPAKATKAVTAKADQKSPTKRDDTPVNSVRAFRAMSSRQAVRSQVDGEVASFTSHGAMILVTVGRGTKVTCYVPLKGLGRPAPTRARDVLKLGERRTFRVVAYDEERRIAELSMVATGS